MSSVKTCFRWRNWSHWNFQGKVKTIFFVNCIDEPMYKKKWPHFLTLFSCKKTSKSRSTHCQWIEFQFHRFRFHITNRQKGFLRCFTFFCTWIHKVLHFMFSCKKQATKRLDMTRQLTLYKALVLNVLFVNNIVHKIK